MTWMRLWPHWWHNLRFCHGRVIEFFCRWRMRVHAIGMQGKHIEKLRAGYGLSWVWSGNGYHQQFAWISYATWKGLCFRSAPAAPIRMLDRWIYIRMYDETWWGRGLFVWWSTRLEKRNIQEKRLLCDRTREKGENLDLSESKRLDNSLERRTGVEPASQPWEGRILPLN